MVGNDGGGGSTSFDDGCGNGGGADAGFGGVVVHDGSHIAMAATIIVILCICQLCF